MRPSRRLRLLMSSCVLSLAMGLSPITPRAETTDWATREPGSYRFLGAWSQHSPSIRASATAIGWRQPQLAGLTRMSIAGLTGMNIAPAGGAAAEKSRPPLLPWTGLGSNALGMFSGSNALLHLSAIAGTFLIVQSELDTSVHNDFARHESIGNLSWPGVGLGGMFPAILGGSLLGWGLTGGSSSELASAGSAVLQSALLAVSYSTVLKALTGRSHPEPVVYDHNEAPSTFHFGFLRGGVFWGWPSGHLIANTAAITSLITFYKDKTWLKVAGGAYLGYLFLCVISHEQSSMHWFSDAFAGTLMGYAIGRTVGRDFRSRWDGAGTRDAGLSFSVTPRRFSVSFSFAL